MKPRIIQIGRLQASLETALAEEFDTHPLWREADPAAFLAKNGGQFVGMATSARFGADAKLMDALPALRVISNFGVGKETRHSGRQHPGRAHRLCGRSCAGADDRRRAWPVCSGAFRPPRRLAQGAVSARDTSQRQAPRHSWTGSYRQSDR